jgi:hypothetical protein
MSADLTTKPGKCITTVRRTRCSVSVCLSVFHEALHTYVEEGEIADPLVAAEALGDESAKSGVALSHPPMRQFACR